MRDDLFLMQRLEQIWILLFNEIPKMNNVVIKFKGKSKNKFGHIKKIGKDTDRKQSIVKKPIFLKIKVEKIEFSKTSNNLRVLGAIIEAPDDIQKGEHHSFSLEPETTFTLIKKFKITFP